MITGGRDGTKHVFHVAGAEPGEALALSPYRAYVHEIRPRRSRASPASQPSPAQCTVLSAVSELAACLLASGGAAPSPLVERPLSALERAECVEVFVAGVALHAAHRGDLFLWLTPVRVAYGSHARTHTHTHTHLSSL